MAYFDPKRNQIRRKLTFRFHFRVFKFTSYYSLQKRGCRRGNPMQCIRANHFWCYRMSTHAQLVPGKVQSIFYGRLMLCLNRGKPRSFFLSFFQTEFNDRGVSCRFLFGRVIHKVPLFYFISNVV